MAMAASSPLLRVSPISFLIFLLLLLLSPSSASSPTISYADHCDAAVPESAISDEDLGPSTSIFQLSEGIFAGADALFGGGGDRSRSFYFIRRSFFPTHTPGVLQISATLTFRSSGGFRRIRDRHVLERSASQFHLVAPRMPRTFFQRGSVSFDLSGYWSEVSGKICMVGTGHGRTVEGKPLQPSAVFELDYPKITNISSSLVKGSLKSLDDVGSSNHFDRISVLAYASGDYEYTQIPNAQKSCAGVSVTQSLGLGSSLCYYMKSLSRVRFELDYGKNCSSNSCGPFAKSSGFTPNIISFSQIQCSDDGKLHMYVGFSNISTFYFSGLLIPEKALVSEGIWDHEKQQVCLVACRIKSSPTSLVDSTVDACTIRICLWFPAVWSIESRSTVVGRIWSESNENDSDYFDSVSFSSTDNYIGSLPGLKYNYTRIEVVKKSCVNESSRSVGKRRYPDGTSFTDFRFDASVSNSEGRTTLGYFNFNPVSIGQTLYGNLFGQNGDSLHLVKEDSQNLQNISYEMHFTFSNASLSMNGEKISAEGIYNAQTGLLCMAGCRSKYSWADEQQISKTETTDCEIVIRIQFAPLNAKQGERLTGTVRSTRSRTDPLYFEPLKVTSVRIYKEQAIQSMWRMDIEIIMVMITLTLSCVFIGLQLFYVKKNPEVLPSVCITMVAILTLGHMIPLVLNFQALFRISGNQNVLSWSGGWLEVNEVIVRVITMVAFLLQFRFLQLSWTARSSDERKKDFWTAEKNAIKMCLPLYFVGGLIAWFFHTMKTRTQVRRPISAYSQDSLWGSSISYAGLILDGFLFPQVIFNIISSSKDKALSPSFYVGNTLVRALPHAYDAYRSRHYVPRFNPSYLYASPQEGFYSLVCDIIIPCGGILLALLIYLQQRFGGTCFFPSKYARPRSYELVPIVNS